MTADNRKAKTTGAPALPTTARGAKNSIQVEFEDGYSAITSRWNVRKVTP